MKGFYLILILMLVGGLQLARAQKKEDNLKPYFFVLLKKGSNRGQDSLTAVTIQKGHMENINRLAASGKLNVAGPFLDEGDMMGIFIFDCSTEDSVKVMLETDPAVKSGRLAYEIHPWMTQKGTCFK
ncbi:MAG: hypothetical protein KA149_05870 [Chitinophagales bacterium]|nr:hypothetical protein [Chitinophagales bacterium]